MSSKTHQTTHPEHAEADAMLMCEETSKMVSLISEMQLKTRLIPIRLENIGAWMKDWEKKMNDAGINDLICSQTGVIVPDVPQFDGDLDFAYN